LKISISPNPSVDGAFNLTFENNFELDGKLRLYNSVGQLIDFNLVKQTNTTYNISGLGSGIYFLHLMDSHKNNVQRLIVN